MIFWYTDNDISQIVANAFHHAGYQIDHINNFTPQPSIFYGIHRGCGHAMHTCKHTFYDYYYVDNGYFDAEYIDKSGKKNTLDGTYRIVKNGMHERYERRGYALSEAPKSCLLIPPSPYSAYFHNTTPEEFIQRIARTYPDLNYTVRTKGSDIDLVADILKRDCVIAFNSMAVIKAVELGKPVMDTHGIFQGTMERHNIEDLKGYYLPKQYTLQDIAGNKWKPESTFS